MNYRHAFHAGNFADLVKHAALGLILDRLLADPAPLLVVDTHAGAGVYDLGGEMALKSGEAQAAIGRLMAAKDAPAGLAALRDRVAKANPPGRLTVYPGSPLLVAARLRPGDAYVGAELRPDDCAALTRALARFADRARAREDDGYVLAGSLSAGDGRRLLALIDPPFERGDDYDRAADLAIALSRRRPGACVVVWLPLKDLETFDRFLRRLEAAALPPTLVVEARLKPLHDPMRMNGCALVILSPPAGLAAALTPDVEWIVAALGEAGSRARLWPLPTPEG